MQRLNFISFIPWILFISVGLVIATSRVNSSQDQSSLTTTPPKIAATKSEIIAVTATPESTPIPAPTVIPTVVVTPTPVPTPRVPTDKYELMRAANISQDDMEYVDWIISKESGWQHTIWNSQGSGAYGYCQALPASKMASVAADYMDNPITQLKWCNKYAHERYGGWYQAFLFWGLHGWW